MPTRTSTPRTGSRYGTIYGAAGHSITISNPALPAIVLHSTKLADITADIDDARVYGGIHFRFDQEGGARLGRDVATSVYLRNLRKVAGHQN